MSENNESDILILGAGIAGLRAAESAVKTGLRVTVVSRGAGASPGIIGFNAPIGTHDSVELFRSDILKNGAGESLPELAEILAAQSAAAVSDLEHEGIVFDRDNSGYQLLQPLGCSVPRLVHSGNQTGPESIRLLNEFCNMHHVRFLNVQGIRKLLTNGHGVCGAEVMFSATESCALFAKAVVLALGGGGVLFSGSTYPNTVSGTGYALAIEAGLRLRNLEFVQFEPCRAIWPKPLGISTTLLAHGGTLRNGENREFLSEKAFEYSKAELAYLIGCEISRGKASPHGGVWLDLTDVDKAELQIRHAMYYQRFRNVGIDLGKTPVEVAPAAHTFLGGVEIDPLCRTALPGLFAAGEVTGGIHGANRIGGNAGTEVYVFGRIAGQSAADYAKGTAFHKGNYTPSKDHFPPAGCRPEIGQILAKYAGILRSASGLESAREKLEVFQPETVEEFQQRRTAIALIRAAQSRSESLGVHHRMECLENNRSL